MKFLLPLILSTLLICSCSERKNPSPPIISGNDAFARVSDFYAIGPKVSGTPGAARAAEHIRNEISRLGLTPVTDEWSQETPAGRETIFRNISVTVSGEKGDFLIIGAHYDTKKLETLPNFAGANDGASGTGLLLSFLDIISKTGAKPGLTLKFIFLDGEEAFVGYDGKDGLYGSRREASELMKSGLSKKCRGAIIIDMIGDSALNLSIPSNSDAGLADKAIAAAASIKLEKFLSRSNSIITDDHVPFAEIGIPSILLIDFEYGEGNRYWHTAGDTLDKISPKSLEATGNLLSKIVFSIQ